MNSSILLVDDEEGITEMIRTLLEKEGFNNIHIANTSKDALVKVDEFNINLIILDIMLPDVNGFDLCKQIRVKSEAPIIFLSARGNDFDKIKGLTIGGDDYMTKPFNPMELVARITVLLRRNQQSIEKKKQRVFDFGRFSVNVEEGTLDIEGEEIKCPLKEFELLTFLCENPNRIFSIQHLYEKVWREDAFGDERTVMVHIRRLRKKIELDPNNPKYLINIRGFGYKLVWKK